MTRTLPLTINVALDLTEPAARQIALNHAVALACAGGTPDDVVIAARELRVAQDELVLVQGDLRQIERLSRRVHLGSTELDKRKKRRKNQRNSRRRNR